MEKRCQIFTPKDIVIDMLDMAGFSRNLWGKRFLENSCGRGNFLIHAIDRYIKSALHMGKSTIEIKNRLQSDFVGYEIDPIYCSECKTNLNKKAEEFGIIGINWDIRNEDFLLNSSSTLYDFIIGNPPYISYKSLSKDKRKKLKSLFDSCKIGKPDYCYAFIEHSLKSLSEDGMFVYLVPISIFKNVHAVALRNILKPFISQIIDYNICKLFKGIGTSSAVIICSKSKSSDYIKYEDRGKLPQKIRYISKSSLGNKWIFDEIRVLKENTIKFGDLYSASIAIATLLNRAFVVKHSRESGDFIITSGGTLIEKSALMSAASPRSLRYNHEEHIIFPYYYNSDGKLMRYSEEEFEGKFSYTFAYLYTYKADLVKRDSDVGAKWFEYGRSQSLAYIYNPKILISTIVTNKVETYKLKDAVVPYAGIYIRSKNDSYSIDVAEEILRSADFYSYVEKIGIYASGNSIRITPSDVGNYDIPRSILESIACGTNND